MLEESIASVPSIWASMNSWLTPSVLFLLLNLMIGTIAITSSLATHKPSNNNDPQSQEKLVHSEQNAIQLGRSPSVLQRLKSINFYHYRSQEPTPLTFEKPQDFTSTATSHFSSHQETLQQDHFYLQQQQQLQAPPQQPPLSRSPSMLQRLRSINFYNYLSTQPKTQHPSQQEKAFHAHYNQENFQENDQEHEYEEEDEVQDQEQTLDEIYSKLKGIDKQVGRSLSDTKPSAGGKPSKLSKKMKKSASSKSTFSHFEEEDIEESRRPATVREGTKGKLAEMDDSEVDAKADDFINKFKQQLKLQRLDSIMRYKEMIGRGSGK